MQGLAGGPSYQYHDASIGLILTVYHDIAGWHVLMQQSGVVDWFIIDKLLTWDAANLWYAGTASRSGGPGFACHQTIDFVWRPRCRMGEQVIRNPIDELTPDLANVWRWRAQEINLPGSTTRFTHNGGQLWLPDHQRGLTRKYGSQGVPPVEDVYVEWYP